MIHDIDFISGPEQIPYSMNTDHHSNSKIVYLSSCRFRFLLSSQIKRHTLLTLLKEKQNYDVCQYAVAALLTARSCLPTRISNNFIMLRSTDKSASFSGITRKSRVVGRRPKNFQKLSRVVHSVFFYRTRSSRCISL
jgi:hypothetical protein